MTVQPHDGNAAETKGDTAQHWRGSLWAGIDSLQARVCISNIERTCFCIATLQLRACKSAVAYVVASLRWLAAALKENVCTRLQRDRDPQKLCEHMQLRCAQLPQLHARPSS